MKLLCIESKEVPGSLTMELSEIAVPPLVVVIAVDPPAPSKPRKPTGELFMTEPVMMLA